MPYSDFEKAYKYSIRDDTSPFFQNSGSATEPSPFSIAKVTIVNNVEDEDLGVYFDGAMVIDNDHMIVYNYQVGFGETGIVDVVLFNGVGHLYCYGMATELTGNITPEAEDVYKVTGSGTITVTGLIDEETVQQEPEQ